MIEPSFFYLCLLFTLLCLFSIWLLYIAPFVICWSAWSGDLIIQNKAICNNAYWKRIEYISADQSKWLKSTMETKYSCQKTNVLFRNTTYMEANITFVINITLFCKNRSLMISLLVVTPANMIVFCRKFVKHNIILIKYIPKRMRHY